VSAFANANTIAQPKFDSPTRFVLQVEIFQQRKIIVGYKRKAAPDIPDAALANAILS